jgi:site-specific recombinase XerD
MNIQTVFTECLADMEANHPHETYRAYRNGLNKLWEYLAEVGLKADMPIADLKAQHLIDYPSWLGRKRYLKPSIIVFLVSVRHLVDWMIEKGVMESSHAEALRLKRAMARVRARRQDRMPKVPAKGLEEKIIAAARTLPHVRDRAILEFLYSSGCRRAEVAGLTVEDVDLDERSAKVTGKGDKQRTVFFSTQAAELLRLHLAERGNPSGKAPMFCRMSRLGNFPQHPHPISTSMIAKLVDKVCMLAGVDKSAFSPHSFRHAFAIRVLRETHDLALVQDFLGHASPQSTRVYATIYPDELRDAHHKIFK